MSVVMGLYLGREGVAAQLLPPFPVSQISPRPDRFGRETCCSGHLLGHPSFPQKRGGGQGKATGVHNERQRRTTSNITSGETFGLTALPTARGALPRCAAIKPYVDTRPAGIWHNRVSTRFSKAVRPDAAIRFSCGPISSRPGTGPAASRSRESSSDARGTLTGRRDDGLSPLLLWPLLLVVVERSPASSQGLASSTVRFRFCPTAIWTGLGGCWRGKWCW